MERYEKEIILQTLKEIANSEREHIAIVNDLLDSLCDQLEITIPERREEERRR